MTPDWPHFYVVGAPRCGTTFLWQTLRQLAAIYMPAFKEPLFFCSDLYSGTRDDRRIFIRSQAEYLALFRRARRDQLAGEACVFNLLSTIAARRIHEARPDARVIVSLRNPVEQMISFHASRVGDGVENLPFEVALDAWPQRARGERLPPHARILPAYDYRAVARYAPQVERYLDIFGPQRVHVIMFEDLTADTRGTVATVLRFLGLDAEPRRVPGVVNAQRAVRWPALATTMRSRRVISAMKHVAPERLHPLLGRAADLIAAANLRPAAAPLVDEELRRRLREEVAPDVERLSALLGLDLAARWLVPVGARS